MINDLHYNIVHPVPVQRKLGISFRLSSPPMTTRLLNITRTRTRINAIFMIFFLFFFLFFFCFFLFFFVFLNVWVMNMVLKLSFFFNKKRKLIGVCIYGK